MNNISYCICGKQNNISEDLLKIAENNIFYIKEEIGIQQCSYNNLKEIADSSKKTYTVIILKPTNIELSRYTIKSYILMAEMSNADMLFSDYYETIDGEIQKHPLLDNHIGSVRDDFELGQVILIKTSALRNALKEIDNNLKYSALYALRLKFSEKDNICRIPEYLYSSEKETYKDSEEKIFDYVDPKNIEVQIEMENTFTQHLKNIGAYLKPPFKEVDLKSEEFNIEASVIIPVKNRAKTIKDAIESVLIQKANFNFNIIIIDNHSDDGTTEIIEKLNKLNNNIIHIIPESNKLGIGGCWNEGINNEKCGKFAIQLDSDDTYNSEETLQQIIDCFYKESCAMVIGSYQMTDLNNKPIAPGVIDHKEWTKENGSNNALRINGLGAPRAFYTPIIRENQLPNVSYGEDYAVGIAISREYKIGRIYTPIYNCRRWEGNSDANIDIFTMNKYNTYKDGLRFAEIKKRKQLLKK